MCVCVLQHNRFVQECKDAEPDVLFVGDSMVQLMQQYEVCGCVGVKNHVALIKPQRRRHLRVSV